MSLSKRFSEHRTVRTCSILRTILVTPRTMRPRRSSSSGALMPHAYDTTCRRQKGIQPLPNTAIALPNPWYTCTAPWRCVRTTGCSSPRTASFGGRIGCCIIAMCAQCVVSRGAVHADLADHGTDKRKNPACDGLHRSHYMHVASTHSGDMYRKAR